MKEAFRERYCYDITEWKDIDDEEIRNWFDRLSENLGGLAITDYTDNDEEMDGISEIEADQKTNQEQHRLEMLEKLHTVKFQYIWPGNWKVIGFTEREIWVNSKGYGYLMCDEPNEFYWSGDGLSKEELKRIKRKLKNETLKFKDIQGTSLEDALNQLYFDDYDPEEEYMEPNKVLKDLLHLSHGPVGKLYACMDDEGPVFFDKEEDFRKFYERDWCAYA